MYKISPYSQKQAKKLNVLIKSSTVKNKKIDVFKDGKKVVSIGDSRYKDYPTYIKEKGKAFADERRKLYKQRHEADRHKQGTAGFYADRILW